MGKDSNLGVTQIIVALLSEDAGPEDAGGLKLPILVRGQLFSV